MTNFCEWGKSTSLAPFVSAYCLWLRHPLVLVKCRSLTAHMHAHTDTHTTTHTYSILTSTITTVPFSTWNNCIQENLIKLHAHLICMHTHKHAHTFNMMAPISMKSAYQCCQQTELWGQPHDNVVVWQKTCNNLMEIPKHHSGSRLYTVFNVNTLLGTS